jgi:hypothetical protein
MRLSGKSRRKCLVDAKNTAFNSGNQAPLRNNLNDSNSYK